MHSGSITWDSPVIEYQYSVDNASWHSQEAATDKYRREKQVGGNWKAGYQYKGIDGSPGSNGSDANVPQWVKDMPSTYIDSQWVISPNIYGGKITSNTTIDIGTDASIGSQLYLTGDATPNHLKGVWFGSPNVPTSVGVYTLSNEALTVNGRNYLNLISKQLNLEGVESINWGGNAPVARFA